MRGLLLALLAASTACVNPGSYLCAEHQECGEGGSCEDSGFCSFPDDSCQDGRRYGEHAGDLGGGCVASSEPSGPVIVEVVAGAGHNCAVRDDGAVFCWGGNSTGALGDGSREHRSEPVPVANLPPVTSLAAGSAHTCALDEDGGVWCWGAGSFGQLGAGAVVDSDVAAAVVSVNDVIALAAGDHHSCALERSGQVYCWGRNERGQLGLGSTSGDDNAPAGIAEPAALAIDDAVELVADGDSSCARRIGGSVVCWGSNENGQLGLGDTNDRHSPVRLAWLEQAVSLAVGGRHLCALDAAGTVRCAGDNQFGQLGDRSKNERHLPVDVLGMSDAVQVSAGRSFSCARGANEVTCWGRNLSGELGDAAGDPRSAPGAAVALPGARAASVSAGNEHACALAADRCVWCWGDDELGQLGNGSATGREPARVQGLCANAEL